MKPALAAIFCNQRPSRHSPVNRQN